MNRAILHVDMDAFFASVEALDDPALAGLPLVVGGSPESHGVVAAASYEARRFGVRSGMPMAKAVALCPGCVRVPPRHGRYEEVSKQVLGILRRYTPLVEQVSVDEACLDVTGSARLFGDAREIAVSIKKAVRDELGLTASIGVAANRLVAKIASDLEKPDGLVAVRPGAEAKFLAPLPVEKLPGVGPRTAEELRRLGVRILGELAAHPAEFLAARFGTLGPSLRTRALGEDATPVTDISKRGQAAQKSVSAEITLRDFTDDPEEVDRRLLELSEEVAARAREEGIECRTITLKLRDDRFATRTRAETLPRATNLTREVFETARGLYRASPVARGRKVRLLGVALSKFSACGAGQMELLVDGSREREKRVEKAVDDIRGKMGGDAVVRGLLMDRPRRGQET